MHLSELIGALEKYIVHPAFLFSSSPNSFLMHNSEHFSSLHNSLKIGLEHFCMVFTPCNFVNARISYNPSDNSIIISDLQCFLISIAPFLAEYPLSSLCECVFSVTLLVALANVKFHLYYYIIVRPPVLLFKWINQQHPIPPHLLLRSKNYFRWKKTMRLNGGVLMNTMISILRKNY